jgi:hypothetical protein
MDGVVQEPPRGPAVPGPYWYLGRKSLTIQSFSPPGTNAYSTSRLSRSVRRRFRQRLLGALRLVPILFGGRHVCLDAGVLATLVVEGYVGVCRCVLCAG